MASTWVRKTLCGPETVRLLETAMLILRSNSIAHASLPFKEKSNGIQHNVVQSVTGRWGRPMPWENTEQKGTHGLSL